MSGYVTESYEGLDTAFSEVSQLPSRGYCDLYRAKRYGRWYLLKCLKPSNVMITHNGGYVKLIDFGLADTDSHTILKQPAGTLSYMAPEQAQMAQADVRNDIYSLGVIMQEMNR